MIMFLNWLKRGSAVERAWKAGSVVGSRLVCWEGAGAEDADQTAGQLGPHVPPPPLNGGKSALAMVRRSKERRRRSFFPSALAWSELDQIIHL